MSCHNGIQATESETMLEEGFAGRGLVVSRANFSPAGTAEVLFFDSN